MRTLTGSYDTAIIMMVGQILNVILNNLNVAFYLRNTIGFFLHFNARECLFLFTNTIVFNTLKMHLKVYKLKNIIIGETSIVSEHER